jgi:putative glutamine amidotransferase
MNKTIGIVGWKSQDHFGVSIPYLEYLSRYGKVEILLPDEGIKEGLDLLILPGGPDVNPLSYGEVPGFKTGNQDVYKQYFFDNNLRKYIENNTPIFGICLGLQQIGVIFGCKLVQDMSYTPYSSPRGELVEELSINKPGLTRISQILKQRGTNIDQKIKVNSLHHQCIESIPDEFDVIATSKSTNTIEAIFHKTLPIAGVQWHPEEMGDNWISRSIIKTLLG